MSRKNLRTQLEELRQEKEQLETDDEAARKNEADLTADLERLREENERLLTEKREATEADGRDRGETERLLDEQCQLHEDIQTELAEAVERGNSLEDHRSSLEDRLLQALEEDTLERLKPSGRSSKMRCCSKCKSCSDKLRSCKALRVM